MLIINLVPAQINRGYWYGTVVDETTKKVLWSSNQLKRKGWARKQAEQELKRLQKVNKV